MKNNIKVFIFNNPYPFDFIKLNYNGKPVLFGDFSNGVFGVQGWIESECEWDKININKLQRRHLEYILNLLKIKNKKTEFSGNKKVHRVFSFMSRQQLYCGKKANTKRKYTDKLDEVTCDKCLSVIDPPQQKDVSDLVLIQMILTGQVTID